MTAIGGAPESISIDGVELAVASDSDPEVSRGGRKVEVKMAQNGRSYKIITAVPWMIGGLQVLIDRSKDDLGFLQSISNRLEDVPIAITWPDGTVEAGLGTIDDEIKHSAGSATATIALKGGGELAPQ